MAIEYLTRKSTGWYKGCGCGQKAGDLITPPADSSEGVVMHTGTITGASGQVYSTIPTAIAIDLLPADAAKFKADGMFRDPPPGYKGYLARKN